MKKQAVYERRIFCWDHRYYFVDDLNPEDISQEDIRHQVRLLKLPRDLVGTHQCRKSIVYDDMKGYTDVLQREEQLPDGHYIVCYYWWDGRHIIQLVDWDISREQVIQNVLQQRYLEGAAYFRV